jgi:hypothetical protein
MYLQIRKNIIGLQAYINIDLYVKFLSLLPCTRKTAEARQSFSILECSK